MSTCKHIPNRIETELGMIYRCLICGQDITHWERRFWNGWIKFRIYCSRGEAYIAEINAIWNLCISAGVGASFYRMAELGFSYKVLLLPLLIILQKLLVFYLGWKDYTKWKLAQRENTFGASLSPFTVESLRILNELRDKIVPEKKQKSILDEYNK